MRFEENIGVNPLSDIFKYIETIEDIPLTNKHIEYIGKLFNTGGVFPETSSEVVDLLVLFNNFYGLIEIVIKDNIHYLRMTDGKDLQQA